LGWFWFFAQSPELGLLSAWLSTGTYLFSVTRRPLGFTNALWSPYPLASYPLLPQTISFPYFLQAQWVIAATVSATVDQIQFTPTLSYGTASISYPGGSIPSVPSGSPTTLSLQFGVNRVVMTHADYAPYTYEFDITREAPMAVSFSSVSPAVFPPFNPVVGAYTISSIIISLEVTFTLTKLTPTSQLYLNGAYFTANVPSNQPLDLTSSLAFPTNTLLLASPIGNYTWTFQATGACSLTYACVKMNQPKCQYKCQYCQGAIPRLACLLDRPSCCGQVGCVC
jgi:hypothetical protein